MVGCIILFIFICCIYLVLDCFNKSVIQLVEMDIKVDKLVVVLQLNCVIRITIQYQEDLALQNHVMNGSLIFGERSFFYF
jgi:hypothetical protein